MKMKKIAAASLAACVCALSGMSALADVSIVTTTGYDYNAKGTDSFTVTSTVTGVTADKQVTYLVWNDATKAEDSIAYIDQVRATDDGTATFGFSATKDKLYPANTVISAKFGTDDSDNVSDVQKTFALNEGVNVITNGTAFCTEIEGAWNVDAEDGKAFCGTVSGNVKEYGVKIGDVKYPAAGSDNEGKFCVIVKGLTGEVTAEAYAE